MKWIGFHGNNNFDFLEDIFNIHIIYTQYICICDLGGLYINNNLYIYQSGIHLCICADCIRQSVIEKIQIIQSEIIASTDPYQKFSPIIRYNVCMCYTAMY